MSPFKRNLIIGYSLSLLLLLISAIASYVSIRNLLYNQELVAHTNRVISKLEEISSILKDAETAQRGFLLTAREEYLDPYKSAVAQKSQLTQELKTLVSDNPYQIQSLGQLEQIADKRLALLQTRIDEKIRGKQATMGELGEGRLYMEQTRKIIEEMQKREQSLLSQRTDRMQKFSGSTPILILVASLLSIVITVISFLRVKTDYENRSRLQDELLKKDEDMSRRLKLISQIADRVARGDYKTRVNEEGKDVLGNISFSLNRMAESLQNSFARLSEKEWVQTGLAELNEQMIGEKNLEALTGKVLTYITNYTSSDIGAFYLVKNNEVLELSSTVAVDRSAAPKRLAFGEHLAGKAAATRQIVSLDAEPDTTMTIHFSGGSIQPKTIIAVPVSYEKRLKGIIEIGSVKDYPAQLMDFLRQAAVNIGTAIHSALDDRRLQELLSETQAQSEELQAQQSELENINAELEAQAERLQASEEELKVQQEELQQSNQELEERSRMLEEKNELILERNLEIQQKADELEQSTRYKSEFLANMSHELRTPLNSILLLSRLLSENHSGNLDKDQVEYASVIQNSGKGLLTLIDEILDLSKIESGKMELEYAEISFQSIATELNALFAPLAKEKGLQFSIELDPSLPAKLETDKLRVEQILRNLLSNALKFTKRGSVRLRIAQQEDQARFSVKDTGIGIPANKQQTIFEAFQQADGSTRRQYGGTGLGLSISRELARLLQGEISLISEEGKGSEFILTLPMQKTADKTEEAVSQAPAPENVPAQKNETEKKAEADKFLSDRIPDPVEDDRQAIRKNDKSILIIEDDTGFARSLLDYTRQKGYKGIVAVRGDEGIELAKTYLPIGILLDVQLPVKSGWDVMEELKSHPLTRPIPVHMMSSHEVKTRSLSHGAVDFINKPVAFEKLGEMFSRIEKALTQEPKKVLIVEENPKHAQALAYFLQHYQVKSEIRNSVGEGILALNEQGADCVILDMGIPAQRSFDILEEVKKTPGLENLPIIVFTGKNLSHVEERKIRQYADSIVVKTANSYQRILDEVSLFLHLVEGSKQNGSPGRYRKLGELSEVLKGKTVLIADDDVRNIFSLTKSLETYGMNVLSAIDGKEALKQLAEHKKVDLVLMDMMMPEMDGYESTREIRRIPAYRNLPIIAVTAKAMTGDREKCIAAGASDYITKPVDVDQLLSLLRVWLYE